MAFFATPERRRWTDGEVELDPLAFRFDPYELGRRLSPSAQINVADLLVKLLAAVAAASSSSCTAWPCCSASSSRARSPGASTSSSQGTERLRQGDFSHPIRVTSRDQLGDLAESFNVMAESVQDLLRESGGQGAAGGGAAHRAQDPDEPAAAGNGHPARAARGRALPARGRGGGRLLRPAAAFGHAHGRAGGGRLGQGHVGRAVHGGAEGAGAVAVADLRVPGAAARRGEPHPVREHGPAIVHHHDLRGRGHRAGAP